MVDMIDKDDRRIRKHLQSFIPTRLEALEMTEADLSRATGDSKTQIGRVTKGINTPSLAFAARLAEALHCSIDELCGVAEPAIS